MVRILALGTGEQLIVIPVAIWNGSHRIFLSISQASIMQ
jgi:hypothetical protein